MPQTIGLNPTGVDDSPQFGLGNFGAQADQEYVYVQASAAISSVGSVCVIDSDNEAAPLTRSNDSVGNRIGIAQAAIGSGKYAWLLVRGETEALAAANCAANVTLYATNSGGVVDDSGSGVVIENMVAVEAAGSMQELVKVRLVYPQLRAAASGGGGGGGAPEELFDNTSGTAMSAVLAGGERWTAATSITMDLGRALVEADDNKWLSVDGYFTADGTTVKRGFSLVWRAKRFRLLDENDATSGEVTESSLVHYMQRNNTSNLGTFGEMGMHFTRGRSGGNDTIRVTFATSSEDAADSIQNFHATVMLVPW